MTAALVLQSRIYIRRSGPVVTAFGDCLMMASPSGPC